MDKKKSLATNRKADTRTPSSYQTTPEIEEGPYYKPGSPERTRLYEEGMEGDRLTLTGYVMDVRGKPLAHAWLDFWQANASGQYDNTGYILRGHQYSDESGKYILETIVPAGYFNRTPHIHVKVRANESSPILTIQLFLPGVASNQTDFLYRQDLEIDMRDTPQGKVGKFNFVVENNIMENV
jgi:protocatechuate 3,4-dioxygenase beta subunit